MRDTIPCRICDHPSKSGSCYGCNIFRLYEALVRGKLDWAKDEHNGIVESYLEHRHRPVEQGGNRMNHDRYDFRDINRGFKRKVTHAKNKGETELVLGLDFAMNVAQALDSLVFYWKYAEVSKKGTD